MNDDTHKLLKVFGVAVTDAEAEAEKLVARAGQLTASSTKEETAALLKDAADLCRELNTRWLESPSGSLRSNPAFKRKWRTPPPSCKVRNEVVKWLASTV